MADPGYTAMRSPFSLEAGLEVVEQDMVDEQKDHKTQRIMEFIGNPLYMGMLAALILTVEMGALYTTDTLDDFVAFLLRRLEAAIMFIALSLPFIGKVIHHFHEQLQSIRFQVNSMPHTVNGAVVTTLKEQVTKLPSHIVHGVKTEVPAAIMAILHETMDIEKMIGPKLEEMEKKLTGAVKDVPPSILHEIRELRDMFANKFGHMKDGLKKAGSSIESHASHAAHKVS